jgi:2-phospho-L-lactate/phosphoenolpyruvate guanylyltransferase
MATQAWIVVLIKDFAVAKTRLASVLSAEARHELAVANASRALAAAREVAPVIAICGSMDAAVVAQRHGVDVVLEAAPRGQNAAAQLGLAEVQARGGDSALLLSSDLPLVDAASLTGMLARAQDVDGPVAVAAAALGRQGTNALYLRPAGNFDLHFGDASLSKFAGEARVRGRAFIEHHDPCLGLDLDEASDVAAWRELQGMA